MIRFIFRFLWKSYQDFTCSKLLNINISHVLFGLSGIAYFAINFIFVPSRRWWAHIGGWTKRHPQLSRRWKAPPPWSMLCMSRFEHWIAYAGFFWSRRSRVTLVTIGTVESYDFHGYLNREMYYSKIVLSKMAPKAHKWCILCVKLTFIGQLRIIHQFVVDSR